MFGRKEKKEKRLLAAYDEGRRCIRLGLYRYLTTSCETDLLSEPDPHEIRKAVARVINIETLRQESNPDPRLSGSGLGDYLRVVCESQFIKECIAMTILLDTYAGDIETDGGRIAAGLLDSRRERTRELAGSDAATEMDRLTNPVDADPKKVSFLANSMGGVLAGLAEGEYSPDDLPALVRQIQQDLHRM